MNENNKRRKTDTSPKAQEDLLFKWCVEKANEIVKILGKGHRETIYHEAFCLELRNNGISYDSERVIPVTYKGQQIGHIRSDVIIDNKFVLEFKAINKLLGPIEIRQVKNYMDYTEINKGLLINFGKSSDNDENIVDFVYISE
jgi:GxxExxY protein